VTLDVWESELAELRVRLGSTKPMRLRWRWQRIRRSGWITLWHVVQGNAFERSLLLVLYPVTAQPGDRAQVEIEVVPNPAIDEVEQRRLVQVAGNPEPGHAAVVVIDGDLYWPTYPCSLRLRTPRY
jgi:hypothetical protein